MEKFMRYHYNIEEAIFLPLYSFLFFSFHLFSHLKTDEMMPALRRRSRCNILERIFPKWIDFRNGQMVIQRKSSNSLRSLYVECKKNIKNGEGGGGGN